MYIGVKILLTIVSLSLKMIMSFLFSVEGQQAHHYVKLFQKNKQPLQSQVRFSMCSMTNTI